MWDCQPPSSHVCAVTDPPLLGCSAGREEEGQGFAQPLGLAFDPYPQCRSGMGKVVRPEIHTGGNVFTPSTWNGRAPVLCPWFSYAEGRGGGLEAQEGEDIQGSPVLLKTASGSGPGAF